MNSSRTSNTSPLGKVLAVDLRPNPNPNIVASMLQIGSVYRFNLTAVKRGGNKPPRYSGLIGADNVSGIGQLTTELKRLKPVKRVKILESAEDNK